MSAHAPDDASGHAGDETHHWDPPESLRDLTDMTLGDFHVERLIGRGGMGEVYLARQISLNRSVALKVLRPDLLTRPTYLSRFEAEAAAVARLNHPNIVHVYTLGSVEGVRFIAMEYVQGTTLKDYLRKKTWLDYPLALSVMRQAALAVGAAGEVGLVHRDIKPENLLLTKKGQVKVTDFGLCRDLGGAERMTLTQPGVTMGTPMYMSPEQAQGHALDHRSDLYSLGVTFYHMIAGVPPFKADSVVALAVKHVKETPASIAVHRPDVPPELDRLVLKLLAKSPSDRYQSAAEMLRDLARVRESLNLGATTTVPGDVTGQTPAPPAGSTMVGLSGSAVESPSGGRASIASTLRSTLSSAAERATAEQDALPWLTPKRRVGLITLGLVLGAAWGWLGRPADLIGSTAPQPTGMPALWLAPAWPEIERRASPEEQYRLALIRDFGDAQEAAWLAVPGHFPNSREWAARAYTQLARRLLRQRDADRLNALASDLERWEAGKTHGKLLADVARAGALGLQGDLDGVLKLVNDEVDPRNVTDPALLELCLEVTDQAERMAARPGAPASPNLVRSRIREVQQLLISRLILNELREPVVNRPRPG